jgi:predicted permease
MHRLFHLALKLVPASWRDTVRMDLEQDTQARQRPGLWRPLAALAIGIRLRTAVTSSAAISDLLYAVRSLRRARWFALGAIITFALGIGVNVAVFSAVDRILFRPLPYGDPDRLFTVVDYSSGKRSSTVSAHHVSEMRRQHHGFVDVAIVEDFRGYATSPDDPPSVTLAPISVNALRVLQVAPMLGRGFSENDQQARRAVVLLTAEAWTTKFGRATDIIGRRLWRGVDTAEIIGVLPSGFISPPAIFDVRSDGLALEPGLLDEPASAARVPSPTVRLRPGVTVDTAEAELNALIARLREAEAPQTGLSAPPTTYRLTPLRTRMFERHTQYVWLIVGAGGLVLLMCCANLANLWLVRGRSREHVAALQIALGASRARIVRAALTESIVLAILSTAAAIGLLWLSNRALTFTLPAPFNRYIETATDVRVLMFSAIVAVICGATAALWPGLRASHVDVLPALQQSQGRRVAGRLRGASTLLIIETVIGVLLVAGGATTARSLVGLLNTDLGFQPDGLHQVSISFAMSAADDPNARMQQYLDALEVLRRTPGIDAAAAAIVLPTIGAIDQRFGPDERGYVYRVTGGFLETMGARLLAGRLLQADEVTAQSEVAVLTEAGVSYLWPGIPARDAIGRLVKSAGRARRVVGVVADIRGAMAARAEPTLYVPMDAEKFRFMMYVARTAPGRAFPATEVRDRTTQLGAIKSRFSVLAVTESLHAGIVNQRFRAVLFGLFGQIALILAAVGLYAITALEVTLRRSELGVRLSLGASAADIQRKVLFDALRPVLIGVVIGTVAAWWCGRFLQEFLHEVDARDPWTLALVAVTLVTAAMIAAWLPARRAARTDPTEVLRAQ